MTTRTLFFFKTNSAHALLAYFMVTQLIIGCAEDAAIHMEAVVLDAEPERNLDAEVSFCESVTFRFSHAGNEEIEVYPDDRMTQLDGDSPTGIRLLHDYDRFPWLDALPRLISTEKADVERLTGFGHNASVMLRFDGPAPPRLPHQEDSTDNEHLVWLDLDSQPPKRVPFKAKRMINNQGLILDPLTTLTAGHRYAVLLMHSAWSIPICRPSNSDFSELLSGALPPTAGDERFITGLETALLHLDLTSDQVFGGTVFTTHHDHTLLRQVADEVRRRNYTWNDDTTCRIETDYRVCDTTFNAWDFRDPKMIRTTATSTQWTLPIKIFLPVHTEAPHPVLIYGHGLNSDRSEGHRLAQEFTQDGYAIVAIDAMMHGDHPTRIPNSNLPALDFLGIMLSEVKVDGMRLSGNFTQTAVDRLQLLELIRSQPDFNGDGIDDFQQEMVGYYGASMGGMVGSILLAIAKDIPAAVLTVSGGSLVQFLIEMPQIDPFRPALNNLAGGPEKTERVLVFIQTIVDAADPATFAPFVLRQRFHEDRAPHLLMPVADQDDTVPPATAHALARALGIPHVGPVYTEVFGLVHQETPVADNTVYGVTAGYFQFDRMTEEGNRVVAASHADLPPSPEGLLQTRHFLGGWLNGSIPEVIDPFRVLDTPPLSDSNID